MKHLGQRYVQYVNRAYRRSGTLWEGRFRSCLAQEEGYVLACQRYLELNPVRAQMVKHPRHYRWSSYRTNAEGKASAFSTPHAQYLALGSLADTLRPVLAVVTQHVQESATRVMCGLGASGRQRREERSHRKLRSYRYRSRQVQASA